MANTYTVPGVLLSGTHSGRPAANTVASGTLYAETDTGQIYQSNASAWSAWGAAALVNPMSHAGALIVGGTAGAPTELVAGSDGDVLTISASTHVPVWQAPSGAANLAAASAKITAGDYTTSSTSFADVDGTNLSLTITSGARRVAISVTGGCKNGTLSAATFLDVTVDATRLGGTNGICPITEEYANGDQNASFVWITDALTAASHTFKLQWRVNAGTSTLYASSTCPLRFAVVELLAA